MKVSKRAARFCTFLDQYFASSGRNKKLWETIEEEKKYDEGVSGAEREYEIGAEFSKELRRVNERLRARLRDKYLYILD